MRAFLRSLAAADYRGICAGLNDECRVAFDPDLVDSATGLGVASAMVACLGLLLAPCASALSKAGAERLTELVNSPGVGA